MLRRLRGSRTTIMGSEGDYSADTSARVAGKAEPVQYFGDDTRLSHKHDLARAANRRHPRNGQHVITKNGFPLVQLDTEEDLSPQDATTIANYRNQRDPSLDATINKNAEKSGQAAKTPTQVMELSDLEVPNSPGKLFGLHGMEVRASDKNKLDALAYVPNGFDATKPVNLVVHVHGWWKDLRDCWQFYQIGQQMQNVDPQTIVVMPAWQVLNGNGGRGDSSSQGSLLKPGAYAKMIQETLDKTPGLQGLKLGDMEQVSVVSHSAGYVPTGRLLKDLGSKVTTLSMLDSPRSGAVDNWIQQNKRDLRSGRRQYFDIYNAYRDGGQAQLKDLWGSTSPLGQPCTDTRRMQVANKDEGLPEMSRCSVIYIDSPSTHFIIPQKYLGTVIDLSNELKSSKSK